VTAKRQRLVLLLAAGVALTGATALGLSAIGDSATYFYSPSDFAKKPPAANATIRLGGLVSPGSIEREGTTVRFAVTDNKDTMRVVYSGLTPDLFKEGSGIIATGRMGPDGVFRASELLAKHDEKYMPPEVAKSLHKTDTLKKS